MLMSGIDIMLLMRTVSASLSLSLSLSPNPQCGIRPFIQLLDVFSLCPSQLCGSVLFLPPSGHTIIIT